jgi:spore coat protein U-like protein
VRALALGILLLAAASSAKAACTLSASGVNFGVYNPAASSATYADGLVTLQCSANEAGKPFTIALTAGGGSYSNRSMASGGLSLAYQLYLDAAHSQIWGDGSGGSGLIQGTIPRQPRQTNYPVYGRIAPGLTAAPGVYTDLIVVTLSY